MLAIAPPLTIIAGFPAEQGLKIKQALEKMLINSPKAKPRHFLCLNCRKFATYTNHNVNGVIRSICTQFIQNKQSIPEHMSLIYLESDCENSNRQLLKGFIACAQTKKISKEEGKKWHDLTDKDYIEKMITVVKDIPAWKSEKNLYYMYLPLRNYISKEGNSFFDICITRAFEASEILPIDTGKLIMKSCGHGNKKCPNKRGKVLQDNFGHCFVRATAKHGTLHFSKKTEQANLESLYRFGQPIGAGEHYDVQKCDGDIAKETFICEENGYVPKTTRPYVNIYPNDYVR